MLRNDTRPPRDASKNDIHIANSNQPYQNRGAGKRRVQPLAAFKRVADASLA